MIREPVRHLLALNAGAALIAVAVTASVACNSTTGGTTDSRGKDVASVGDHGPRGDANADHSVKVDRSGKLDGNNAKLDQGGAKQDKAASPDGLGPCKGKTCAANELCIVKNGQATCVCTPGYIKSGQGCVLPAPGSPCDGQTCSGHGTCSVMIIVNAAQCECFPGYISWGLACIDLRVTGCLDAKGSYVTRGTARCDATDTFLEVCHDGNGDGLNEWIFGVKCVKTPCSTACLGLGCANGQACPVGTVCVPEAHQMPLNICVPTCDCSNCGNCSMADFAASGAMQAYCGSKTSPPTAACKMPCPLPGDGCIPYSPAMCWPMEGCLSKAP
jgi:hypothetical protein